MSVKLATGTNDEEELRVNYMKVVPHMLAFSFFICVSN